jgi:5-methylcytosine-specific restriction enzyme subunit McrC
MALEVEAWSSTVHELTPEVARAIDGSDLASIEVADRPGHWCLVTDSRVGVLRTPDWELRVAPRLAVPKLMFLLGYAKDADGWKAEVSAQFETAPDFFLAIASGFAEHAQRALDPAPLRGYVNVDETSPALRGRLRIADQMSRSAGLPLPLEISYDDYQLDVVENQLLRTAADFLLRFPMIPPAARKRLRKIRATLIDVSRLRIPYRADLPEITRLNERYEVALVLASLILRRASIGTKYGAATSIGFVFDMNKVFEDFLSASLKRALRRFGGEVRLQYEREYLAYKRQLQLKPDITWWKNGGCRAVIDAKYKRLDNASFPNADAYQMLAYCAAFHLPLGYLVYARDEGETDRDYRLRDNRTTIKVRAIDVESEPSELLAQVAELAGEIAEREVRLQAVA